MVARVPLFADLDAGDVGRVMRLLRSRTAEAGEVIARRGEVGHAMYLVASGAVEIEGADGVRHRLDEGGAFGEVAVLRDVPRSGTARAVERTRLLVLEAGDLRRLMARRPTIAARIEEAAHARLAPGSTAPDAPAGEAVDIA